MGWLFCEGADHGSSGQWFHAACLGIFTPSDYTYFKLCIGCTSKIERSSYSSRATSGDSCAEVPIVKCSPHCSGCSRVCDAGMDFLSQEQRKGLWSLVVEDHFARLRVRFRPGDHVHVERERRANEGPSTREASKNVNMNMNNNKNQISEDTFLSQNSFLRFLKCSQILNQRLLRWRTSNTALKKTVLVILIFYSDFISGCEGTPPH